MRAAILLVTLVILHTALAAFVAHRDPVAVLFATRGLADPVGVAAMATLVLVRLGVVLGGPGAMVLLLARGVRTARTPPPSP
jgi:hypothetical protein